MNKMNRHFIIYNEKLNIQYIALLENVKLIIVI